MGTLDNTAIQIQDTIGGLVAGKPHLRIGARMRVDTILALMAHHNRRMAGVVDIDGCLLGLVTRSALFGRLVIHPGFDVGQRIDTSIAHDLTAADVMIANPVFLPAALSMDDALSLMSEHGFRSMPVLEDGGVLVGFADWADLVQSAQDHFRETVESKDSLLSYFMHHEAYGKGSRAPVR
jgi:CBS-domain-containing membrane protein